MPMNAETAEVIKRHYQLAVIGAAVVTNLDLKPVKDPTRG